MRLELSSIKWQCWIDLCEVVCCYLYAAISMLCAGSMALGERMNSVLIGGGGLGIRNGCSSGGIEGGRGG